MDDYIGENFVSLVGKITKPNFKELDNNNFMFKASLAIPAADNPGCQYIKISAWGNMAEALNEVPSRTFVKIHGHIEESSYNGQCRHCGGLDKKYWTEVLVDNFIVLKGV
jgi:hypothetical protein